jgi:hypothetical protein
MKYLFIILIILSTESIYSQSNKNVIVPFLKKNGLYTIVTYGTNNPINSETYSDVEPLSNGFCKVRKDNNKWGVVNDSGQLIIPIKFNLIQDYKDGFLIGRIKKDNVETESLSSQDEPSNEDSLYFFDENDWRLRINIKEEQFETNDNYSINLVNKKNIFYLPDRIYEINDDSIIYNTDIKPSVNIYKIPNLNNSYDSLDGEKLINYLDRIPVSDNLFLIKKLVGEFQYFFGCEDKDGNTVIPIRYSSINTFNNGLSLVELNQTGSYPGSYGYINQKGEPIIPFKNKYVRTPTDFSEGLLLNPYSSNIQFYDSTGKIVLSLDDFFENLDEKFQNGLFRVRKIISDGKGNKKYEEGYINKKGVFLPFRKEWSLPIFNNNYELITGTNNKFGIIDINFKLKLDTKYDLIFGFLGDYEFDQKVINDGYLYFNFPYSSYVTPKREISKPIKYVLNNIIRVEQNGEIFYVDINGNEYKEK